MDPWEKLADDQIVAPVKARMRAVEKRRQTKREKEEAERKTLFAQWQKWHQEKRGELLAGPHAAKVQTLTNFLESMSLEHGNELIALVAQLQFPPEIHEPVLSLISHRIIYLREQACMSPFDDALPFTDEDLTVFEIIRKELRG